MNVKLLRKVKRLILAEPKRFDMDTFGRRRDPKANDNAPRCGTVGCIAGWAVILTKRIPRNPKAEMPTIDHNDGMEALNISDGEAKLLFYAVEWPEKFSAYVADGSEKSAKIAAQRIEHFIKTKGKE
jgi:hypothetical protein